MTDASPDAGLPGWSDSLQALAALLSPRQGTLPVLSEASWQALADLVIQRHRVAPLIAARLPGDAPADVAARLREAAEVNGRQTLHHIAATAEILTACRAEGIDPVLLKGWPLAERLYGAPGQRQARDLDLLVQPDEMPGAAAVLHKLGFTPAPVYRLRGRLIGSRALAAECYDLEFHHPGTGLAVELHWRTSHFPGWPEVLDRPGMIRTQQTRIGPVRVPAEAADLIYLSGHGCMHVWARLKWLADIAWLAEARGAAALEADLALAHEVQAWTTTALALRLAHRAFGAPLPASLLTPDPALGRHENRCLALIADPNAAPGGLWYRVQTNLAALRLAETGGQLAGVMRYALWRRLRLGLAGLRKGLTGSAT